MKKNFIGVFILACIIMVSSDATFIITEVDAPAGTRTSLHSQEKLSGGAFDRKTTLTAGKTRFVIPEGEESGFAIDTGKRITLLEVVTTTAKKAIAIKGSTNLLLISDNDGKDHAVRLSVDSQGNITLDETKMPEMEKQECPMFNKPTAQSSTEQQRGFHNERYSSEPFWKAFNAPQPSSGQSVQGTIAPRQNQTSPTNASQSRTEPQGVAEEVAFHNRTYPSDTFWAIFNAPRPSSSQSGQGITVPSPGQRHSTDPFFAALNAPYPRSGSNN